MIMKIRALLLVTTLFCLSFVFFSKPANAMPSMQIQKEIITQNDIIEVGWAYRRGWGGYGYRRGWGGYGYRRGWRGYGYRRGWGGYGYRRGWRGYGYRRGWGGRRW